jgi:hypothetical protein
MSIKFWAYNAGFATPISQNIYFTKIKQLQNWEAEKNLGLSKY